MHSGITINVLIILGHSNLIYWFTSKDGDDYGLGGQNKIVNMYHVIAMNIISWNRNLVIEEQSKRVEARQRQQLKE